MKTLLPLVIISLLFIIYRAVGCVMEDFPVNTAPMAALFFCAVFYAGMRGLMVSAVAWLVSYPLLSALQGYGIGGDFWASLLGYALIILGAFTLKKKTFSHVKKRFFTLLGGSLLGAVTFYAVTNFFSWCTLPVYPKTWEGFYQAQWAGVPDFLLPTWVFLRNSLIGNGCFVLLFSLSQRDLNFGFLTRLLRSEEERVGEEI